jgi:hypothetical protein
MNQEKVSNILMKVLAVLFFLLAAINAIIGKYGAAVIFVILAVVCLIVKVKPKQLPVKEVIPPKPERFVSQWFKVAGVTFKNDDGSSRQAILKLLCDGDKEGGDTADIEQYIYENELAFRVKTEDGCIGNIRREDVREMKRFYDHGLRSFPVDIESFTADRKRIYRAEIEVRMDRENPDHQWFFDEMQ